MAVKQKAPALHQHGASIGYVMIGVAFVSLMALITARQSGRQTESG
jgi:hypothetical protein